MATVSALQITHNVDRGQRLDSLTGIQGVVS